jgi:hypothetical protein
MNLYREFGYLHWRCSLNDCCWIPKLLCETLADGDVDIVNDESGVLGDLASNVFGHGITHLAQA